MSKKSICLIFVFILFSGFIKKAIAQNITINTSLNTGIVGINAKEMLFDNNNHTTSFLDWNVKIAPCIFIDSETGLSNRLFFRLNGFYTIPFSNGQMCDYDWMNYFSTGTSEQTHFSNHKNEADALYNFEFAVGTGGSITQKIRLIQYFSVKYTYLSMTAKDGYRQYGTKTGEQNGNAVYTPWNSEIEKKQLDGDIVTLQSQDVFLGFGTKIIFETAGPFKTELFFNILPGLYNDTLDTHYNRSEKYTYFDFGSKLEFDTNVLLEYKINNSNKVSAQIGFSACTTSKAQVFQGSDIQNLIRVSNPGKFSALIWNIMLGYSYRYEN